MTKELKAGTIVRSNYSGDTYVIKKRLPGYEECHGTKEKAYVLENGGWLSERQFEVVSEPPEIETKSIEDMLVSLSREIVDLKKNQTEMAYKLDELSKRISDDEMAELGAEIVRVVERRLGNIERN